MIRWQGGLVAGMLGLVSTAALQAATPVNMPAACTGDMTPAQSAQMSLDLAAALERTDKIPEAIALYERALALDAKCQQAMRRLAVLYSKTGQFDRADTCFQKAAAAQPKNANVFNDWGRSYYLRSNWTAAEAKFRMALQIEPRHRLAVNNLALALGQEKRYTEAFQIFRNGGLSEAQCHCNIAYILFSQGRADEARKACMLAKQIDANCVKADDLLTQLGPTKTPEVEKASFQGPAVEKVEPVEPECPKASPAMEDAGPQPVYQSPDGRKWYTK
ncbi:MAG TPA: tetratricopeptide repeat protein [Polyangiaceae bacterium]|jgi:Tfp pilus assembly protein PilF|nr:tetratricopeptide repeat protein [Polyangiaceae bacterium]